MSEGKQERVEAYLVAGGKYHDIDFARTEILKLLAEHPHVRTQVAPDYRDVEGIVGPIGDCGRHIPKVFRLIKKQFWRHGGTDE